MKRLVSATLALTLLGATAAVAEPYDRGGQGYEGARYGYGDSYRDDSGAIVAGVGILTLGAILASQHRHHRYHYGWYNRRYAVHYGDYGSRDHRW